MPRRPQVPAYRLHKQSGQAIVTIPDGYGGRKDHLLGSYDSPQSWELYTRLLAEWKANGHRLQQPAGSVGDITVNELCLAYFKWAEGYYQPGGTTHNIRDAIRVLRGLYGAEEARKFGPLSLKACREEMVSKGWSRSYTNEQTDRLRRIFRWGASEELIPASVHEALRTVSGLRKGKTQARESKKIRPVLQETVDATLPHLRSAIQAMVKLQLLTGARPGEICALRPCDLDTSNPACWVFRPVSHKTEHHDHERYILMGPRAQEVLKPWLGTKLEGYCFSPAREEESRNEKRKAARKSPLTPSQRTRAAKARRRKQLRPPGEKYTVLAYRNAIYRACDRAFLPPEPLCRGKKESKQEWQERLTPEQKVEVQRWQRGHRWHPNQLRHTRATELRSQAGLDLTKTVLGHTKIETSQVYAERDLKAAMELISKIG